MQSLSEKVSWKLLAVGRKLCGWSQPPPTICPLNLGSMRAWLLKVWSTDEQNRPQLGARRNYRIPSPVPDWVDQTLQFLQDPEMICTCIKVWKCPNRTVVLQGCLQDQQDQHHRQLINAESQVCWIWISILVKPQVICTHRKSGKVLFLGQEDLGFSLGITSYKVFDFRQSYITLGVSVSSTVE